MSWVRAFGNCGVPMILELYGKEYENNRVVPLNLRRMATKYEISFYLSKKAHLHIPL